MLLFDVGQRTEKSNFGIFFKENPHFNRLEIWVTYLLSLDVQFIYYSPSHHMLTQTSTACGAKITRVKCLTWP
jgi:hypothetical protein